MENEYKIQLVGIDKSFPGVHALTEVSFDVRKGTVHSIVGENGAGKSTLMKIINGVYLPDKGHILVDGKKAEIKEPKDSADLGIAMIYQELQYVPSLTIEENLVLNKHPVNKLGFVDWKAIRKYAEETLEKEGLTYLKPTTVLRDMSISDIQLLEIVKATTENAQIIIMDEPTSSLTQYETERLFKKIDQLRSEGKTILYISHKMDEIFRLSDDVTVMRDGCVVNTRPIDQVSRDEIITMMVGREVNDIYPTRDVELSDEPYFECKNLCCGKLYQDVSFYVRKGEIVGFAGLVGAGRTEIMRGISGFDPTDSGSIYIEGKECKHGTVAEAVKEGIMMATEDRRKYGIIPPRNIKENITIASLQNGRWSKGPFVDLKEEEKDARYYFDRMRIKARDMNTLALTLSGGNQQKLVLAKWMTANPKLFVLDEPTRGIDVGAKHEIYNIMNEMAAEGMAIIMVSSELPELLGMCDRIYVVHEGRIAGELQRDEFTQERVMNYATGGK